MPTFTTHYFMYKTKEVYDNIEYTGISKLIYQFKNIGIYIDTKENTLYDFIMNKIEYISLKNQYKNINTIFKFDNILLLHSIAEKYKDKLNDVFIGSLEIPFNIFFNDNENTGMFYVLTRIKDFNIDTTCISATSDNYVHNMYKHTLIFDKKYFTKNVQIKNNDENKFCEVSLSADIFEYDSIVITHEDNSNDNDLDIIFNDVKSQYDLTINNHLQTNDETKFTNYKNHKINIININNNYNKNDDTKLSFIINCKDWKNLKIRICYKTTKENIIKYISSDGPSIYNTLLEMHLDKIEKYDLDRLFSYKFIKINNRDIYKQKSFEIDESDFIEINHNIHLVL